MKTYTMPDGFETTIVDDRERRKEKVSEKEAFDKLLDFAEKKAKKLKRKKLLI